MWIIIAVTVAVVTILAFQHAPTTATNSIVHLSNTTLNATLLPANTSVNTNSAPVTNEVVNVVVPTTNQAIVNSSPAPVAEAVVPISNFFTRVTKKPFGIYITPKTSPVQPERFQGYHTGADAETTTAEKNIDVPIYAVAGGKVVLARYVSGYGGVIMIQLSLNGKTYTTLYGHLRQSSFTAKVGANVKKGQKIAVLGTGYSSETDGERKHLHFGVLKGASTNVKGYVSSASQLSPWVDPVAWLHSLNAAEPTI